MNPLSGCLLGGGPAFAQFVPEVSNLENRIPAPLPPPPQPPVINGPLSQGVAPPSSMSRRISTRSATASQVACNRAPTPACAAGNSTPTHARVPTIIDRARAGGSAPTNEQTRFASNQFHACPRPRWSCPSPSRYCCRRPHGLLKNFALCLDTRMVRKRVSRCRRVLSHRKCHRKSADFRGLESTDGKTYPCSGPP